MISLTGTVFVRNSTNYNTIFKLQFSLLLLNSIEVSNNYARQVLMIKSGSYVLSKEISTFNVYYNTLYIVAVQERIFTIAFVHFSFTALMEAWTKHRSTIINL